MGTDSWSIDLQTAVITSFTVGCPYPHVTSLALRIVLSLVLRLSPSLTLLVGALGKACAYILDCINEPQSFLTRIQYTIEWTHVILRQPLR